MLRSKLKPLHTALHTDCSRLAMRRCMSMIDVDMSTLIVALLHRKTHTHSYYTHNHTPQQTQPTFLQCKELTNNVNAHARCQRVNMSTLFGFINLCCPRTLPFSYLPFKKLKRIVPEPLSVYLHGTIEMSLFWVTHSPRASLYARYPRRLVRFGSVQN